MKDVHQLTAKMAKNMVNKITYMLTAYGSPDDVAFCIKTNCVSLRSACSRLLGILAALN